MADIRKKLPTNIILLGLIFLSLHAKAQDYQREINEQVWRPFMSSFNALDTENFLALHSKDIVRCSRDSKELLNWQQYHNQMKHWDNDAKQKASLRSLELRFIERIANENQAIDIGIYKTTSTNNKGESKSFYGKFHVVLRKENGIWKILVDTDSSEGNTIGEKQFLEAKPLE